MDVELDEIEEIYRREGAAFERTAIAIIGDEQLGCDAVHDAFVLAIRNRASFRGDAPLTAWLWRIVVNEASKRRARRPRHISADALDELPGYEADQHTNEGRVRELIAELPERQRLVLFLRHYADLDYAAIAHALSIREGTVAATLHAAHTRLREQLQEVPQWEL
jgi:RNA polymerase sigma-70 factor (ECF subfamily)